MLLNTAALNGIHQTCFLPIPLESESVQEYMRIHLWRGRNLEPSMRRSETLFHAFSGHTQTVAD